MEYNGEKKRWRLESEMEYNGEKKRWRLGSEMEYNGIWDWKEELRI